MQSWSLKADRRLCVHTYEHTRAWRNLRGNLRIRLQSACYVPGRLPFMPVSSLTLSTALPGKPSHPQFMKVDTETQTNNGTDPKSHSQ